MRVGADRFQVVLIGEIGIGSSAEGVAENVAHGFNDVFLPEEAVAAASSEVAEAQSRRAAEPLHFFPEFCFGAGIENIQLEFAEALQVGACLQFADGGKRINFPHRRGRPKAVETEGELAVLNAQFVVGEAKVALEPLEEGRLKDAAASIEGVAREPDQLGLVESELLCLFQLFAKLVDVD